MEVKIIKFPTEEDWLAVKRLALTTVGKDSNIPPTDDWKRKILASEHSPIRRLIWVAEFIDIPSYSSVHLVRHKFGIEHYVKSQRNDRQDEYDRCAARQDTPVNHTIVVNAQAIINISKVRMCRKADISTSMAWHMFITQLYMVSPEIVPFCEPTCVYRNGICPEFKSCGYNTSTIFDTVSTKYRSLFNV